MFDGCSNLRNVRLSDNIPEVSCDVFRGCTSLKEVSMPKVCKWIGVEAFKDSGTERIIVSDNMEQCLTLALGLEMKELVIEENKRTIALYERLPYFQNERSEIFFECVRNRYVENRWNALTILKDEVNLNPPSEASGIAVDIISIFRSNQLIRRSILCVI